MRERHYLLVPALVYLQDGMKLLPQKMGPSIKEPTKMAAAKGGLSWCGEAGEAQEIVNGSIFVRSNFVTTS